jgi:2',3'-cyclic-nucleotide 2'-phosphodiesterase/3'-nucleotidase
MKKKLLAGLLVLPLLASCAGADIVDENYTPKLPEFKNKDAGQIKEDGDSVYFDFYEVSDFHGATVYDKESKELGLERLSTYFDEKRKDNPGGSIVLSGGDMWQGSADSNITRGNLVTYGMRVMGFASMTFGNHEFDWEASGTSWIRNNLNRANDGGVNSFPFLGANIFKKGTGEHPDFVKASTIVERGGYKVGIVGTIGDDIRNSILAAAIADLDFAEESEIVKLEAAALRSQGCDIVAWSSHNDVNTLKDKISGISDLGVDVIFGGHSHSSIATASSTGVPMLETKDLGRGIAHCQLKMNKSSKAVTTVTSEVDENPALKDYQPDPDITGIYKQYSKKYIDKVKNRKIGKADGKFSKEDELGNLAVESMFNETKAKFGNYDIAAALTNKSGGVRADLESGKITYGNLYSAFPFDNEIVIVKCTGAELRSYLTDNLNVSRYNVVYDKSIDNAGTYYYLTTDFLYTNESFPFKEGEVVEYTKLNVRDSIADAVKKSKKVKAADYKTSARKEFQKIR